ncbi:LAQU0S11e00188g1_1 [Lachancea quebecensis]|uniref:LAQU0S11e00188g1_1 n=1 Tax=Lachancea quebecensis TaxID=1654605 RepID=A0A0P1KTP3_9SACH|nr:LAQU0S11e00188g1_1 [Lachancea quebecensis]
MERFDCGLSSSSASSPKIIVLLAFHGCPRAAMPCVCLRLLLHTCFERASLPSPVILEAGDAAGVLASLSFRRRSAADVRKWCGEARAEKRGSEAERLRFREIRAGRRTPGGGGRSRDESVQKSDRRVGVCAYVAFRDFVFRVRRCLGFEFRCV